MPHKELALRWETGGMTALIFISLVTGPGPNAAHAAPQLKVPVTRIDLGEMRAGQALKRDLKLRNDGDEALLISRIDSSCSLCASGTVAHTAIEPHGETRLSVTFKARAVGSAKQRQNVKLTLHSNDPKHPSFEIQVGATVLPLAPAKAGTPGLLRQALRGRHLSPEQWVEVIEALPGDPTSVNRDLDQLVSTWHWGPLFQPIPVAASVPLAVPTSGTLVATGLRQPDASTSSRLIHEALAKRLAAGAPRLARLLRRDFPDLSPAAVEQLKSLPEDASAQTRSTALLLLAELALSRGALQDAAALYQRLVDDKGFPESVLAAEAQYPPYSSDPGWHAARRVWRLAQLYWLLGQRQKCLDVARQGLEEFHGARWIRWADLLLPLAAAWAAQGEQQKAKETYALAGRFIPGGHAKAAAAQQHGMIHRTEQRTNAIESAKKELQDPLKDFE